MINDHPHVAPATRSRVQEAMAKLNYRRNMSARLLATGRSNVVGVIAPNSSLYGPSTTLAALSTAAGSSNLSLTVENVSGFSETAVRRAADRLVGHGVLGLLLILPITSAADAVSRAVPDGLPFVTVDGVPPDEKSWTVSVDQYAGAVQATRHLLDAGHPTVWHVTGPSDWNDSRAREAGWHDTLTAAGIDPPPLLHGDWSPASGYARGQLLSRMPDCTAIFAANDHMALGVARAFEEYGRSIPGDVSLVGFDDVPESAYFSPPLTTVHQDFAAVGRVSLELLLGQQSGIDPDGRSVLIPTQLIQRLSTGPYVR